MNKTRFALNAMAALVVLMAASSLAHAQATRTWVSGVGDDANPCSRTAPCKTFAGAISKTAAAGEIDALDRGGFGAVTITKSITIDGGDFASGVLAALTNGIIVNLPNATDRVILRNLAIDGAGNGLNGIRFIQNGRLSVDSCQVYGFGGNTGRGIDFAPTAAGTVLSVRDSVFRNNFGAGIAITPAGNVAVSASLNNVRSENNQNGFVINDNATVTMFNCIATHNGSGFLANGSVNGNPQIFLESCVAANNTANGIRTQGTGTPRFRISNCAIHGNNTGLSIGAGEIKSFGNNHNDNNTPGGNGTPTAPNLGLQ